LRAAFEVLNMVIAFGFGSVHVQLFLVKEEMDALFKEKLPDDFDIKSNT